MISKNIVEIRWWWNNMALRRKLVLSKQRVQHMIKSWNLGGKGISLYYFL